MTATILDFPGDTTVDLPPDKVLQQAMGKLKGVMLIGFDTDGKPYWAGSSSSVAENLLLTELARDSLVRWLRSS